MLTIVLVAVAAVAATWSLAGRLEVPEIDEGE
jgi:hypothetical protein